MSTGRRRGTRKKATKTKQNEMLWGWLVLLLFTWGRKGSRREHTKTEKCSRQPRKRKGTNIVEIECNCHWPASSEAKKKRNRGQTDTSSLFLFTRTGNTFMLSFIHPFTHSFIHITLSFFPSSSFLLPPSLPTLSLCLIFISPICACRCTHSVSLSLPRAYLFLIPFLTELHHHGRGA